MEKNIKNNEKSASAKEDILEEASEEIGDIAQSFLNSKKSNSKGKKAKSKTAKKLGNVV